MKDLFLILLICSTFFYGCEPRKQQDETTVYTEGEDDPDSEVARSGNITVAPMTESPDFPEARLNLESPQHGVNLPAGNITFSHRVRNYELTAHTPDAHSRHIAHSEQGQHIHHILNNAPYTAHYEPEFQKELAPGHYVTLSFLSRSYHEGLKHEGAYVLRTFTVGGAQFEDFDVRAPHMFYSRPKGEYVGDDTRRILLDFYLVNTTLSEDGNRVRATINGQEFILTQWVPFAVEGLPMGKNTFRLELLDADGNLIPGPFNTVERTITLKEGASN
jgi:hypothetical protein